MYANDMKAKTTNKLNVYKFALSVLYHYNFLAQGKKSGTWKNFSKKKTAKLSDFSWKVSDSYSRAESSVFRMLFF